MDIMALVAQQISAGSCLETPSGRTTFRINRISENKVYLKVGRGYKARLDVPAECFDSTKKFLKGKDWVEIGATKKKQPKSGTLEECMRRSTRTMVSCYVASILEEVGLVELDGSMPNRIRLRASE